jgi:hypothetical protein
MSRAAHGPAPGQAGGAVLLWGRFGGHLDLFVVPRSELVRPSAPLGRPPLPPSSGGPELARRPRPELGSPGRATAVSGHFWGVARPSIFDNL